MAINENAVTDTLTPTTGTLTVGGSILAEGTGENFVRQSQSFTTSFWTAGTGVTVVSGYADPIGGTTASLLTGASGTTYGSANLTQFTLTIISSTTFTFSLYVQAGTATTGVIQLRDGGTGTITTTTFTPTSAWQRVSVTATSGSSTTQWQLQIGGTNGTLYIAFAQLEFGSIANTYIPTTSTIVYGTPTLNFSGVSSIGLQNDGSVFVQPAGTGALQAQQTTSSVTGGNARGANAVDWQTSRTAATQVASGTQSTISGGINNTVSSQYGVIGGGTTNIVGTGGFVSTVSGGFSNNSNNAYTFVGGGTANTASGIKSLVVGGENNSALGVLNFIGGGYTNVGTANAAVTTQATSTITSGSTAVTLSGSNASIKVGQYIAGTPIANQTYVAAISGTSLTLSQNATSSTNATLSFYTPHGIVVGGGNNQATGAYSFVGGGGDAGTAANRNLASGDWSVVVGGWGNQATGIGSFVGGGGVYSNGVVVGGNTATGISAMILGGTQNVSSNVCSSVAGGQYNVASGNYSTVLSGYGMTTRNLYGAVVFGGAYNSTRGDAQAMLLVLRAATTDATATVLTSNGGSASTTNQVILPNNAAYYFKGSIIANVTGAADGAAWSFEGAIMRGANAGSTVLIGTPMLNRVAVANGSGGSGSWVVALTADTTNGGLAVTVTGVASTTIRWVAKVETTEVTF
jgi:hypothetical protein